MSPTNFQSLAASRKAREVDSEDQTFGLRILRCETSTFNGYAHAGQPTSAEACQAKTHVLQEEDYGAKTSQRRRHALGLERVATTSGHKAGWLAPKCTDVGAASGQDLVPNSV